MQPLLGTIQCVFPLNINVQSNVIASKHSATKQISSKDKHDTYTAGVFPPALVAGTEHVVVADEVPVPVLPTTSCLVDDRQCHLVEYIRWAGPWAKTKSSADYLIILYYFMLFYVILCYFMLFYAILCYFMLFYAILCYFMLFYVILCYFMLCYVMLCYVMLFYFMLFYVILCYFMLFYVILYNLILLYIILYYF